VRLSQRLSQATVRGAHAAEAEGRTFEGADPVVVQQVGALLPAGLRQAEADADATRSDDPGAAA
jgi:hypothetical protein